MAMPKEGTPYWIDSYAVTWALADQPFLKQVAELWINTLLQLDYQVDYVLRELTQTPVVMNFGESLTPAEMERLQIDAQEHASENRIPQPTVSRRDRNGLKALWEDATAEIIVQAGEPH